jgi:hypothetical protein
MTTPPTFTAHELSALAEQGMTLTEAEEATVRGSALNAVLLAFEGGHESRTAEIERLRADNAALTAERDQAKDELATLSCSAGYALSDQLKRIDELKADNARLREALAPFAVVAPSFQSWHVGKYRPPFSEVKAAWPEDKPVLTRVWPVEGQTETENVRRIYVSDFRRARTAMEAPNGHR